MAKNRRKINNISVLFFQKQVLYLLLTIVAKYVSVKKNKKERNPSSSKNLHFHSRMRSKSLGTMNMVLR
jgi:hypothetical protein